MFKIFKATLSAIAIVLVTTFGPIAIADDRMTINQIVQTENFTILEAEQGKTLLFIGSLLGAFQYFVAIMERGNYTSLIIHSPGGAMSQVYSIGAYLNQIPGFTIRVPENHACISACAFLSLYADNLEIEGIMAFHTPYFYTLDPKLALNELLRLKASATVNFTNEMLEQGYTMELIQIIVDETDEDHFIIFTNEEDLKRFYSPGNTLDKAVNPKEYYKRVNNKDLGDLIRISE